MIKKFIFQQDSHCTLNLKKEHIIAFFYNGHLKLLHEEIPLDEFWIKIKKKYSRIGQKVLAILLQFSTLHLSEAGFSVFRNKKQKKEKGSFLFKKERE